MVRRAGRQDAGLVAELLGELGYPAEAGEVERRLASLGADDLVLLAEGGAGLVALHRIPRLAEGGAFVRITALVVRRDSRGRGVARALLDASEDQARRWGCSLIEVSSGRRPEREPAHRLYRAAGFADTSPRSVRYFKPLGSGDD
jgi:GNAT superfamily N-acetyltransferase